MSLAHKIHRLARKVLLGPTDLPQAIDVPLHYPQREVSIWLHGMGEPRDVTSRHSVACTSPFMFCIGLEPGELPPPNKRLSLKFYENTAAQPLLGEIGLELSTALPATGRALYLFKAVSCTDFCLSSARLRAHSLFQAFDNWRSRKATGQHVSFLETRCKTVTFFCPRPVVLVSVRDGERGNIFPMNLFGTLGGNYLSFALNSTRQAAPLANRLRQLALSSIPYSQIAVARDLRKNHRQQSIAWEQLSFPVKKSKTLDIPVPEFALRVRELKVEASQNLGSHTFFLARIEEEEVFSEAAEFHMIHGHYAFYKQNTATPTQA
jgi:flavin reductase (DIM6/NTAB) family NADH-FMN oxidoreductase RutF